MIPVSSSCQNRYTVQPNFNISLLLFFVTQDIGAGFFIVPLLGFLESIAVGKAFGKYHIGFVWSHQKLSYWEQIVQCSKLFSTPQKPVSRDRNWSMCEKMFITFFKCKINETE